ncbi:MAG: ribosome-associated translation inhibitor RaiA [bacterium]|mgnify:CR=1 FL=1|nr:ribosome-associated translation inhibitor RaiA [bacterium]
MDIHITSRRGKLNEDVHEAAVNAAKRFEHYFEGIIRVDAIMDDDGSEKQCEFTVKIPDHLVVGHEKAYDFSKAIHDASEKVVRQLTKMNERRHDTRSSIARP